MIPFFDQAVTLTCLGKRGKELLMELLLNTLFSPFSFLFLIAFVLHAGSYKTHIAFSKTVTVPSFKAFQSLIHICRFTTYLTIEDKFPVTGQFSQFFTVPRILHIDVFCTGDHSVGCKSLIPDIYQFIGILRQPF